jgi:hypothetical protein
MATLQKETISPLAKESDEEKIKEPADTAKAKKKRQPKTNLQLIGMALKTEY